MLKKKELSKPCVQSSGVIITIGWTNIDPQTKAIHRPFNSFAKVIDESPARDVFPTDKKQSN